MQLRPAPRSKNPSEVVAVLDIGTTKIACLIARPTGNPEQPFQVIGIGHQLSKGLRSGMIVDVGQAETSITAAVHAAEQMAQETLEDIAVGLNGTFLTSRNVSVELALSGDGVSEQDIADIIQEAQFGIRNPETDIIHCFPTGYTLDGTRNIRDPRHMMGQQLGADLHLVTANTGVLRNMESSIARCHLNVNEYVMASHASGLACLEPDEMDLGVTVIDMGGGTTSFSIFANGKNIYADTIPVGGNHVTNDIAKGLSTSLSQAERLKTLHGSAIATLQDEQVMIDVPQLGESDSQDEGNLLPRSMLVGIIRPRMEEIFELLRGRMEASGMERYAGRRVVLTGGGSQLMGVRELAARVLSRQVRHGKPRTMPGLADAVSGPAFSTVIGMLDFMTRKSAEDLLFKPKRGKLGVWNMWERVSQWVRESF